MLTLNWEKKIIVSIKYCLLIVYPKVHAQYWTLVQRIVARFCAKWPPSSNLSGWIFPVRYKRGTGCPGWSHQYQAMRGRQSQLLLIKQVAIFQLLSCIWLFVIPWTAECQISLPFIIFQSLLKLMSMFTLLFQSMEKEMTTYSSVLAEKSHGQRSLAGYSTKGHKQPAQLSDQALR